MDNKKLYICVSLGSPEVYLDYCGEETSDIKEAAECLTKSCAKTIIEEYKKSSKNTDNKMFVIEEYEPKFSIKDFIDDKIIVPLWQFDYKHPHFTLIISLIALIVAIAK